MVIVHSGRKDLPYNARAFSLTSFETQSSSCDFIKVSGRLICLLDLNNESDLLSSGNDGFLQCFVMLGPAC